MDPRTVHGGFQGVDDRREDGRCPILLRPRHLLQSCADAQLQLRRGPAKSRNCTFFHFSVSQHHEAPRRPLDRFLRLFNRGKCTQPRAADKPTLSS